jgi:hypothetical protein
MRGRGLLSCLFVALAFTSAASAETIRVAAGTQYTTINCAAVGLLIRELKLLDKYLPHRLCHVRGIYLSIGQSALARISNYQRLRVLWLSPIGSKITL